MTDNTYPKILVCTVDAWSKTNGNDTMASLLRGYPKDRLACLYIRAELSDSDVCDRYFHILENRVVRSCFGSGAPTGVAFNSSDIADCHAVEEAHAEKKRYRFYKKVRTSGLILVRELLWKVGRWKSPELNAFIDDFAPDIVLFPIEGYIHFNRITEYIVRRTTPNKVLSYLWDDNFSYMQNPSNILFRLHRWWLRGGVRRLVSLSDTVFAICPKMKVECDREFGINSVLLTKPLNSKEAYIPYKPSSPIRILYTGRLIYGRDKALVELVEALQVINKEEKRIVLDIYTDTVLSDDIKRHIDVPGCCTIKGFVPQQEVLELQRKADVLLFAESFSSAKPIARLSFSTKLTDYFSAGKCILAIGNADLGPIEYLKSQDAGLVVETPAQMLPALDSIISQPALVTEYAKKGWRCGISNHNPDMIKTMFMNSLACGSFAPAIDQTGGGNRLINSRFCCSFGILCTAA